MEFCYWISILNFTISDSYGRFELRVNRQTTISIFKPGYKRTDVPVNKKDNLNYREIKIALNKIDTIEEHTDYLGKFIINE